MPRLQQKPFWKALFPARARLEITPFDKLCQDFRRTGQRVPKFQHQYVITVGLEELTRCQSVLYDIRQRRVEGAGV